MKVPEREVPLEVRRPQTFGLPIETLPEPTTLELRSPVADASLRVRQRVALDWAPVPNAERYQIELRSGGMVRDVEVAAPPSTVGLTTGSYTWQVRAYRADRLVAVATPQAFEVVVDASPPPLSIVAPRDGAIVKGTRLEVTGSTEPGATVEIARTTKVADASGAFAISVPITRGLANIVISASDDLGNTKRVTRSVVCE